MTTLACPPLVLVPLDKVPGPSEYGPTVREASVSLVEPTTHTRHSKPHRHMTGYLQVHWLQDRDFKSKNS